MSTSSILPGRCIFIVFCWCLFASPLASAVTSEIALPENSDPQQATSSESLITPWSERAVKRHVQQSDLAGSLAQQKLQALIAAGEHLFAARFTRLDGVGRPLSTQAIIPTKRKRVARHQFSRTAGMDANACSSCHNLPVVGGAGDFSVNVFVSEGFQNVDFDNIDPQFSNERNTNHLMGAGLVELLAREMTEDLHVLRHSALKKARTEHVTVTLPLSSKGVSFGHLLANPDGSVDLSGVEGVDADLTIRPFGRKGVMTSLRQFTINALNHHHGMLAEERFGARWTGETDFDGDGVEKEILDGDVSALVAWQATRPVPVQVTPADAVWSKAASSGAAAFKEIGCASCHMPSLPLRSTIFNDPGPFDTAGTRRHSDDDDGARYDLSDLPWVQRLSRNSKGELLVPLFGDLKRHKIADAEVSFLGNELLAQRFVERDVFITAELWGVGSTSPYGHRGDLTTLDEVIQVHGGAARLSRDAYLQLDEAARESIIAWLTTLRIEALSAAQVPRTKP